MTDYHVTYIEAPPDGDRAEVARRIEAACDNSASEGWYLDELLPDVENGTTRGVWLIFASGEDLLTTSPEAAAAEKIISENQ